MTEEEAKQAVLDAALHWDDLGGNAERWSLPYNQALHDAVDAYRKATAPPEPFEGFVLRWGPTWDDAIYDRIPGPDSCGDGQIYRCTVTPIERVT